MFVVEMLTNIYSYAYKAIGDANARYTSSQTDLRWISKHCIKIKLARLCVFQRETGAFFLKDAFTYFVFIYCRKVFFSFILQCSDDHLSYLILLP